MTLVEAFADELNEIKDKRFKAQVIELVNSAPQYIAYTPASTGGKYHPLDETGKSGMVNHVKRVAVFVDELARMEELSSLDRDVLIAGAILHDSFKQGFTDKINKAGEEVPKSKHTINDHPTLSFRHVINYMEKLADPKPIDRHNLSYLAAICLFHSGQWTPKTSYEAYNSIVKSDKYKIEFNDGPWWKGIIPTPARELCRIMHTADYLASRRSISDIMQLKLEEKTSG